MRLPTGSRLAYLLAVIVLVPLTFALEYTIAEGEIDDAARRAPVAASGGAAVEYAGTRWRLISLRPGPAEEGTKLPRGTTLVFVTVEVSPLGKAGAKKIVDCGFEATDGERNTWTPSFGLAATGGASRSCSVEVNDEPAPIPVGQTVRVLSTFLVPNEAVAKLRPRLRIQGEQQALELRS